MADEKEFADSEVFDLDRIRDLIELMKEHDLNEIDLRHAPRRIRLRRGQHQALVGFPATPQIPTVAGTQAEPAAVPSVPDDAATVIASPMVGTYYSKPKPESPPFVKVGDQVEPETVVCLIEAMKMFNEIPAGISGRIVEVLIKNEEPVDVNRPLFKVATG